jgi:hypothetical protein
MGARVICPECGAEYVPGFTRCSDCGAALVEAKAEPEKVPAPDPQRPAYASEPSLELATVVSSGDSGLIAVAKSLLQSAGIPFLVRGEAVQDLFGAGRAFGGFNIITGAIQLQVRSEDADDARLVLEDLLEGQKPGRR